MDALLEAVAQAELRVQSAEAAVKDARAARRAAIKAMGEAGMSQRQIAAALGLTHGRVAQILLKS